MSCQVVACDLYRRPLTHKERLQRSHACKQLLPSAWPPPPCSCHGLCEKIKKEKGKEKKKKNLDHLQIWHIQRQRKGRSCGNRNYGRERTCRINFQPRVIRQQLQQHLLPRLAVPFRPCCQKFYQCSILPQSLFWKKEGGE